MTTRLRDLQQRRAAYAAAELKILAGQSYTVGQGSTARRLDRADLAAVQAELRRLDADIATEQARSRRRVYNLVPR